MHGLTSILFFFLVCISHTNAGAESSTLMFYRHYTKGKETYAYFSLHNGKNGEMDQRECDDYACSNLITVLINDEKKRTETVKVDFITEHGFDGLLLIDGTVEAKHWSSIKTALKSFVNKLNEKDRVAIATFSNQLNFDPIWYNKVDAIEALDRMKPELQEGVSSTAYKSILEVVERIQIDEKRFTNLVLVSDWDGRSEKDEKDNKQEVNSLCEAEKLPIYSVTFAIASPKRVFDTFGFGWGKKAKEKGEDVVDIKEISFALEKQLQSIRKNRHITIVPQPNADPDLNISIHYDTTAFMLTKIQNPVRSTKTSGRRVSYLGICFGLFLVLFALALHFYLWRPRQKMHHSSSSKLFTESKASTTPRPKEAKMRTTKPFTDVSDFKRSQKLRKAVLRIFDQEFPLPLLQGNQRFTMGSHGDCDVRIPDDTISGTHAEIFMQNNFYFLRDLGSTNGTSIHGQTLSENVPHPLQESCEFVLAQITVQFYFI